MGNIKFSWKNLHILYEAKEFSNSGSFYIKPKAHVEEEEKFEDKRRGSKLSRDVADDNFVLSNPRSRKERAERHKGQSPIMSQGKVQVQRDSHGRIVEEQF